MWIHELTQANIILFTYKNQCHFSFIQDETNQYFSFLINRKIKTQYIISERSEDDKIENSKDSPRKRNLKDNNYVKATCWQTAGEKKEIASLLRLG